MPILGLADFQVKCRGAAAVAVTLSALIASNGWAQAPTGQPPPAEPPPAASLAPQPQPQPPAGAAPAEQRPSSGGGLIDKLGEWLRDSADGVSAGLKDTQQRIQDINKSTLDTLTSIPITGLASGRSLCPRADNGAPDCYAASEKLCKEKGYSSGRSLDTESSETCNPRIYLPGYQRKAGDCRIDTFVTRAACQ
jgi:hypothetical protein